jgi:hypothetical protein
MLPRICEVSPSAVAFHCEELVPGLEKVLEKAAKEQATCTQGKEVLKAVVRAVCKVDRLDASQLMRKWADFSAKVRKAESIADIVKAAEQETADL